MRQLTRKKKPLKRREQKQEAKRRGGKKTAKRRSPSSPVRKSTEYLAGFCIKHPEIVWRGQRSSKEFKLTGAYSTRDLIDNFNMALAEGGAWGYYHAREWFSKLFKPLEGSSWPIMALRNCYRAVYGKDAPSLHPVVLQYLVHGKLGVRWLKEEVKLDGVKSHNMYSTWKNLIPKIIARQKAIRRQDWLALSDMTREGILDSIQYYDNPIEKKGATKMAKKEKKSSKKSKKVSTEKKDKKTSNGNGGGESVGYSILEVGKKKRGTVTRKWIMEKIVAHRAKLKLMKASDADKLRISSVLKKLCENGDMTLVAKGQYSFDGSSKPISGTKAASPKKQAKASKKKAAKSEKLSKKERRALGRKKRRKEAEAEESGKKMKKSPKISGKKHPKVKKGKKSKKK